MDAEIEKLEELISKKEEAKRKVEVLKGRRLPDLEKCFSFLNKYMEKIEAVLKDNELIVTMIPKKEYEFLFERTTPFIYKTILTEAEKYKLKDYIPKICAVVLDRFYREYPKTPFILDFETLARRAGRPRAIEIFMYLAQKGSPFHASFMCKYLTELVSKTVETDDESERKFMAEYLRAAKLNKLADFLTVTWIPPDKRTMVVEAVKDGLKKILSNYAQVYEYPDDLSPEDVKKSWDIVFQACREPEFAMFPKEVDETPIFENLKYVGYEFGSESESHSESPLNAIEEFMPNDKDELLRMLRELDELRDRIRRRVERL